MLSQSVPSNYEDFYAFLEIIGRKYPNNNFKNEIANKFVNAIQSIKERVGKKPQKQYDGIDFRDLEWLYQNIPYFAAKQLNFNDTIENIFRLNLADVTSPLLDFTAAITSILQKLDSQNVYDYFYANPQKLISLYNGFHEEKLIKPFCTYLTAITFLYGKQNIEKARNFALSDNTHIETNILNGDEKGKVALTNELQLPTIGFNGLNFINLFSDDIEINNEKNQSNQFHPLDIIYISQYDENYKEVEKIPSIALYGKYLGDSSEWSDVTDATLTVVDVISIIISGGVLVAGVKGAARLFAIIDIAISTINLAVLNPDLRNRLNKTEAGKWFVSHWGIISFCVSFGTISYYLAKGIVKYNSQLKQQLKNEPELAKQIDELVEESKRVVDEIAENSIRNLSGSGGFLKFKKVISRKMLKQEKEMSCAAACIKQLAKDNGIEISESAIRTIAKTTDDGTYADGITIALKKYFKEEKLDIRLMYDPKITDIEMIRNISKDKNSWIAWISPMPGSNTKHAIIIDKVVKNDVYIRDPWPLESIDLESFKQSKNGVIGIVDIEELAVQWANGFNFMFKIKK